MPVRARRADIVRGGVHVLLIAAGLNQKLPLDILARRTRAASVLRTVAGGRPGIVRVGQSRARGRA